MILFLIYVVLRAGKTPGELPQLRLPLGFIGSSIFLIGVGAGLQFAINAIRLEKQAEFRRWLAVSLALSMMFVLVQSFGMYMLFATHLKVRNPSTTLYGMTFFLALVHALHVVGGQIAILIVFIRAMLHKYDHEKYGGVVFTAMYWHFLDAVWIVMLISFWFAGAYLARQ